MRSLLYLFCAILFINCSGDNNDIVLEQDISNVDLDLGITFGYIDSENTDNTKVYKYSNSGVFLATNTSVITSNHEWVFLDCPYPEGGVAEQVASGVKDMARGVRDLESKDILTAYNSYTDFYILEYGLLNGEYRTIQFLANTQYRDQILTAYMTSIIKNILLLDINVELPLTLDTVAGECI